VCPYTVPADIAGFPCLGSESVYQVLLGATLPCICARLQPATLPDAGENSAVWVKAIGLSGGFHCLNTHPQDHPGRRRTVPILSLLVLGCFAIAALSLILPSVPGKDPWSWIVWGREVAHLDLDTSAGSSWKPLPVLFTTPSSAFGDAAPELWLVVARAGALLAIVFAYRVASRLAGRAAGVVAALCVLAADWVRYVAHGNVEPLCAALVLAAVDRHLHGHRHQAMALGALAALGRAELWPFLALYAVFIFFREHTHKLVVIALLLAVPALWLGGDWWGSGDPFRGSSVAAGTQDRAKRRIVRAAEAKGEKPELPGSAAGAVHAVNGARDLLILPAYAAALAAVAFAIRRRERTHLLLAAAAVALFGLVALMGLLGYGGSPRFLFPAAGLVCVLAGIGVAALLRAAGGRAPPLAAALAVVLIAATAPFAVARAREADDELEAAGLRARLQEGLDRAVAAATPARVKAVGEPYVSGQFAHQLAWDLDLHLRDVGGGTPPSVFFIGPRTRVSGSKPRRLPRHGVRITRLADTAGWRAYAVVPKS
jgi:hypothetical protein